MKMRLKIENRSHRYDKYVKYKMCLSVIKVICTFEAQFMKVLSST